MKKSFCLLITVLILGLVVCGCEDGGFGGICTDTEMGIIGSTQETKLYYPCSISGTVGATTNSSGFGGNLKQVEWLSNEMVAAGFVVLAFTPDNILGQVTTWREAHKNCISKLKSLNSTHAVLRGKINTAKLSTCGFSKGGGGSLYASLQLGNTLATTIGMAPYWEELTNLQLRNITADTFIQAGSADSMALNFMTRNEYDGLSDLISKKYVEYTGYGHASWANATGAKADRLSRDIIAWMKYYLNGDKSQAATIADESDTSRFEWVDNSGGSSSSGGCN